MSAIWGRGWHHFISHVYISMWRRSINPLQKWKLLVPPLVNNDTMLWKLTDKCLFNSLAWVAILMHMYCTYTKLKQWPMITFYMKWQYGQPQCLHAMVNHPIFVFRTSMLSVKVPEILDFPVLAATLLFLVVHQCCIHLGTHLELDVVKNYRKLFIMLNNWRDLQLDCCILCHSTFTKA